MITEERFRTILLEYDYPDIVIKFLWDGRPDDGISESEKAVHHTAQTCRFMIGTLEAILTEEENAA